MKKIPTIFDRDERFKVVNRPNLSIPIYRDMPRYFDGLRAMLADLDSLFSPGHLAEGIVFHHPDGRQAKIKRKDFGA